VHKFDFALSEEKADMPASSTEVIDKKTAEGLLKANAVERNTRAMAALTFALQEDDMVLLLDGAMTDEWPDGLAYLVMEAIEREYRPKNLMQAVNLRRKLNAIKMKKGDAPTQMFKELNGIKARYGKLRIKVNDDDLMATAVVAAPQDYKGVLASEQRRLGAKCKLADLCECMEDLWSSTDEGQQNDDDADEETKEVALSAAATFQGKCFKSDEHKPTCDICNKNGHKEGDCWLLEKNKGKRPESFQRMMAKYEVAASSIENDAAYDDGKEMFV
jgi:gag-polypeptide of LTR copia-type